MLDTRLQLRFILHNLLQRSWSVLGRTHRFHSYWAHLLPEHRPPPKKTK